CPEMVVIPGGSFTMGSPPAEKDRDGDEGPQRSVSVGRFALGRYAVTRGEFAVFVRATGRRMTGDCTWSRPGFAQTDRHPVVCVNWSDAKAYAAWLSAK